MSSPWTPTPKSYSPTGVNATGIQGVKFTQFTYECYDDNGKWYRSYGNENWAFDDNGLMARRIASINDLAIAESERLFHWPQGRRPDDHPGLSELGL